jgi:hypothetical protein
MSLTNFNNNAMIKEDSPIPVKILSESGNDVEVNSGGQLRTVMRGVCDEGNSTTTPLLANDSFVGTVIDTLDYSALSIVVHSDVDSGTDGLEVDYSANGTDWHSGELYTIKGGSTKFFTPALQGRYLRVKYTNGGTDQTEFHLQLNTFKKIKNKKISRGKMRRC